jgi:hypothetical protein
LIELLTVIAILAVLATLAIAFLPNAASSERESRGAVQLHGWLNIAKQKALRDQAPRGLRLWVAASPGAIVTGNTPVPGGVTDCQYIEQPDDYAVGMVQSGLPNPPPSPNSGYTMLNCLQFSGADLTNGFSATTTIDTTQQLTSNQRNRTDVKEKFWTVQPGDYVEFFGSGLMHQIIQVGVPDNSNPAVGKMPFVVIQPPLPFPITSPTKSYRIVRSPRPVGEEMLKMPEGTLIDLSTNAHLGNPLPMVDPNSGAPGTFVDILFAPSGQVVSRGVTTGNINLWVRAPNNDASKALDPFQGAPTIVSIFVNTGFVGSYSPSVPPTDPYSLIR